jgi:hypothetical protein
MPTTTDARRPTIRTTRGWAISVLREARAVRECENHGWMQDRTDPHAREHAIDIARSEPPPGLSPDAAVAEIREILDSIGDTCPECPGVTAGAGTTVCAPAPFRPSCARCRPS